MKIWQDTDNRAEYRYLPKSYVSELDIQSDIVEYVSNTIIHIWI